MRRTRRMRTVLTVRTVRTTPADGQTLWYKNLKSADFRDTDGTDWARINKISKFQQEKKIVDYHCRVYIYLPKARGEG